MRGQPTPVLCGHYRRAPLQRCIRRSRLFLRYPGQPLSLTSTQGLPIRYGLRDLWHADRVEDLASLDLENGQVVEVQRPRGTDVCGRHEAHPLTSADVPSSADPVVSCRPSAAPRADPVADCKRHLLAGFMGEA